MVSKREHDCEVLLGDDLEPTFANAIRIEDCAGDATECYLDFLLYIPNLDRAFVVSRIKIKREFLGTLREHLATSLGELLFQA